MCFCLFSYESFNKPQPLCSNEPEEGVSFPAISPCAVKQQIPTFEKLEPKMCETFFFTLLMTQRLSEIITGMSSELRLHDNSLEIIRGAALRHNPITLQH